jgi:hypothetical protein
LPPPCPNNHQDQDLEAMVLLDLNFTPPEEEGEGNIAGQNACKNSKFTNKSNYYLASC